LDRSLDQIHDLSSILFFCTYYRQEAVCGESVGVDYSHNGHLCELDDPLGQMKEIVICDNFSEMHFLYSYLFEYFNHTKEELRADCFSIHYLKLKLFGLTISLDFGYNLLVGLLTEAYYFLLLLPQLS